jgi:RNA polymerase sigma-70 factor (ECF subfamily)
MTEREEQNLIKAAQAGDREAVERLIEPHWRTIRGYLAKRARNREDLEDLVSEVLESAFIKIKDFRGEGTFSGWLLRIAENKLKNYYRALQAREGRMLPLDALEEDSPPDLQQLADPECQYDEWEGKEYVKDLLEVARLACTEPEARVLSMVYKGLAQGESYEGISELLGMKSVTLRSHLRRARGKLLAYLYLHKPDLLGGREAIGRAREKAQNSANPEDHLSDEEQQALDQPQRRMELLRRACLKIAQYLPGPLVFLIVFVEVARWLRMMI